MHRTVMRAEVVLLAVLVTWSGVSGGLSFYGYQRVLHGVPPDDTLTYRQTYIGSVQLEVSRVRVTPCGAYLDIVEDAWLSGNQQYTNIPDLLDRYLIKGSFTLSEKAAITGIVTWKNGVAYRAELFPSEYVYDKTYPDSASLIARMNSQMALLQQTSEGAYSLTLSNVDVGERRHVRIRYLLPNEGGGQAAYVVPILCDPGNNRRPERLTVSIMVHAPSQAYTLQAPAGAVQVEDSNAVVIDYRSSFTIARTRQTQSTVHKTTFDDGPWVGTYMQLNTTVPDSVLTLLSKPLEAAILWRWNAPFDFVQHVNGRKALTPYAQEIVRQADKIEQVIEELAATGHRVGLVHSIEGDPLVVHAVSTAGESGHQDLLSYVSTFNQQYLFDTYKDEPEPRPDWAPLLTSGFSINDARTEFSQALGALANLYTGDSTAMRHVVVLSVGSAVTGSWDLAAKDVDSVLDGATVYSSGAQWHGVGIAAVMPTSHIGGGLHIGGYPFPVFRPTTVHLRVDNVAMPYAFPLSALSTTSFAISIMTTQGWDTKLHWYGYDPDGNLIGTTETQPEVYETAVDSGLAKVWAADGSHVAEREVDNPGGVYGFVTKAMFLRAGTEHSTSDTAQGLPFLTADEIHMPVAVHTPRVQLNATRPAVHSCVRGVLRLQTSQGFGLQRIRIFSLDGRLLLDLDAGRYRTGVRTYHVPLAKLLSLIGARALLVSLTGQNTTYSFSLVSGGAL